MIEVNNLVKRYGDHTAVDHLSFKIEKGKIYGFLGPNGAGKSTTMNMITGYIASTEGTVTIDGHDILEEPEQVKKCIGYLPEIPPLYFDMTVLEYMNFAADLKKIPKDKKKSMVAEVMEMVKKNICPRDIMTEKAFRNALTVDMALGCSTNSMLHLPAIAHECGIDIDLAEANEISKRTPNLCHLSPAGEDTMMDLERAGGIPAVMHELAKLGHLNLDCMTVTGKTVGENIKGHEEIGRAHV